MNSLNLRTRLASNAGWLAQNNSEQIVSRRPMTQRVGFSVFAAFLMWLTGKVLPNLLPLLSDHAAAPAAAFLMLILLSLMFCFLLGTGPNQLCLDLRRRQYSLKQGILFLTWTRRGQIGDGEIYVACTRSRQYQVRFRAQHWKYGLPIESLKTEKEARLLAQEIAERLQVSVKLMPVG